MLLSFSFVLVSILSLISHYSRFYPVCFISLFSSVSCPLYFPFLSSCFFFPILLVPFPSSLCLVPFTSLSIRPAFSFSFSSSLSPRLCVLSLYFPILSSCLFSPILIVLFPFPSSLCPVPFTSLSSRPVPLSPLVSLSCPLYLPFLSSCLFSHILLVLFPFVSVLSA